MPFHLTRSRWRSFATVVWLCWLSPVSSLKKKIFAATERPWWALETWEDLRCFSQVELEPFWINQSDGDFQETTSGQSQFWDLSRLELHHSFPASTNHLFDYMHLIKNHQYLRCMTVLICLQTHGNSLYDFVTCLYFAVWHLSFCSV